MGNITKNGITLNYAPTTVAKGTDVGSPFYAPEVEFSSTDTPEKSKDTLIKLATFMGFTESIRRIYQALRQEAKNAYDNVTENNKPFNEAEFSKLIIEGAARSSSLTSLKDELSDVSDEIAKLAAEANLAFERGDSNGARNALQATKPLQVKMKTLNQQIAVLEQEAAKKKAAKKEAAAATEAAAQE